MIYISSYFSKESNISNQVKSLANSGFKNIELTGGTDYYPEYINDLFNLKEEFNLNYKLHNYFPPPQKHFVFNLASLDKQVSEDSLEHAKRSIDLSRTFGISEIGFHAGFFIHIAADELGTDISKRELYDEAEAIDKFVTQLSIINSFAGPDFKVYIENNVVSTRNKKQFPDRNPSMLTCFQDYKELKEKVDFNFLLDVAHLKVSSQSFGLDFEDQFRSLIGCTDYVHVSDNNSLEDQNRIFNEKSQLYKIMQDQDYVDYDFTLEIFGRIEDIKTSQKSLQSIIKN